MDELLEQFLIESRDLIAVGSSDLAALARNPQSTGSIDSAFRAVHTLKGSVALFAMRPAERVLHSAEDILEQARKGASELGTETVAVLVTCLDQIDRWIDELERNGALAADAAGIADRIVGLLTQTQPKPPADGAEDDAAQPAWVAALLIRESAVLAGVDEPCTAFRYTPDADCFFRGDDPLAVVATVPQLLSLAILPATEGWPADDEIEPFACFTVLEGISTAPREVLTAVFRLMPDQVSFAGLADAAAAGPEQGGHRDIHGNRMLRIDGARLEALGDSLGELLVAVNGVSALARQADGLDRALAGRIRSLEGDLQRVADALHLNVSAMRAVPLDATLRRLPRLVREIAESLGKSVDLHIAGSHIEIDKQVADGLFEPLLHLIRNAIDHGIEHEDTRLAASKPAAGKLTLDFARDGDSIVVRLQDDGAGMDGERIRRIALERGVVTAEAAETLTPAATLRLIFAPGFSTAETVTELSGRGVGMNAVETAVEALRGSIEVDSAVGQGSVFTMRFPADALTTRLLLVEAGGEKFGVALDQVIETVGVDTDKLLPVGGGLACVLHGRTVPVLSLAALLGRAERATPNAKLLVTRSSGEPVALRVDGFGERVDSVVKRPAGILAGVPGVVGSALLGDGGVLLVLDLPELAA